MKSAPLISWAEARGIIENNLHPVTRTERVRLHEVPGRVLAADFVTSRDVPGFDRATRDGYAVRSADTARCSANSPGTLTVIGEVFAGSSRDVSIGPGECLRITTGSVLPRGADAVIMAEDTDEQHDRIKVRQATPPGANVGRKGEDVREGIAALKAGAVIGPAAIAVIASQGKNRVEVYARPEVAVIASGDELVQTGRQMKRGQLFDSNSHTIAALVAANGGDPIRFDILPDRADYVRGTIAEAARFDLTIITGGSSVGQRDLVRSVLEEWGQVLFHGVRVRPGRSTLFGLVEGKPLVCLPGVPTACFILAQALLMPSLKRMAHLPQRPRTAALPLGERIEGLPGWRTLLPVRIEDGQVMRVGDRRGAMVALADSDGYVEVSEDQGVRDKGQPVNVTLFGE